MTRSRALILAAWLLTSCAAFADIFGSIRGIVHDPQHRPVENAMVMLHAKSSDWAATTNTDAAGQFAFSAVPVGEYNVTVASPGLLQTAHADNRNACREPRLDYRLKLAAGKGTYT